MDAVTVPRKSLNRTLGGNYDRIGACIDIIIRARGGFSRLGGH